MCWEKGVCGVIVFKQEQEICRYCNKEITIRQYKGLKGAWFAEAHECVDSGEGQDE